MNQEKQNYSGNKKILLLVANNSFVKLITRCLMWFFFIFDRTYSHLKLRVLVEHSSNCLAHWTINIVNGDNIRIGMDVGIGPYCSIGASSPVTIGDNVRISRGVVIETGGLDYSTPPPYQHKSKPINIEDGVWLGTNVIITGGVTVGANSVIGANTVITKNVVANSIVVGSPSRTLERQVAHN